MKIPLLLLITCFTMISKAQNLTAVLHEVKGRIADSASRKPLDYITVGLKTDKNLPVKSALTSADGSFVFNNLKPSKYILTIVFVEYQTRTITVDLIDSTKKLKDLGPIYINTKNNNLKEVVVIADKPLIKQEVDRISYDLQADPESKSNNVLEMMRKVPLLSVDGDDNILLKGNTGYKIFINGKPSSMMERNAKDILKSMPASSIQTIEVITNPPSKYDAEGLAGIINIVTNKKVDNGYNGSVNINERFPVGGPGTGGNFTFKQGKVGISAFGGASFSSTPMTENFSNRISTGTNATTLAQVGNRESENQNGYLGTELSYEIDSLNLISAQFNVNGSRSEGANHQSSVLNGQSGILQTYNLTNMNEGTGNGLDAAFNYQLGFKKSKARLLTFSYRYFTFGNEQHTNLAITNHMNYPIPDYRQVNDGGSSERTFQFDYVHPVKKLSIETGIKAILRNNESDFQYQAFNSVTNQFESDPARTNIFDNNQSVFGAYNTYQYNLKNWGFKAGARIEKTIIDADFITTSSQVRQEYLNVIPSVSINRKFKDMSSLNFGFTQRINRPGIYQLNPFVDRSNPNFESTGNPNLHPTLNNSLQLGYSKSKKGSMNIILSYTFFNDLIMPVFVFDPVTNITRNSYDNTGRARLVTVNFNLNYPFTKTWNFSFNGRISHGRVQGLINDILVKNEGVMYGFTSSSGYRFEKGWRVNANLNVNGPNLSIQGTSNSFIFSTFSVNKDIVKDKLSFSASANNPFSKYRIKRTETFGPNFTQTDNNQSFYRSFNTSLNYSFGKLKGTIKKNKRGISNDDISNNSAQ
ncbi:MAG TPA: outer membrane beta-barrel protein [Sphingobacteriaceae bacterium]|nr:outer membrane beta-barrel protein [Sphingobacteriaceae bacterium]